MFLKVFFIAILLILIGGFAFFAITDVPVIQTDEVETIPASQFQN